MSDLTYDSFPEPSQFTSYGFGEPISVYDYTNYATIKDFESTMDNAIPMTSSYKNDALTLYKSKGKINPEEESPTKIIDEALKHVLNFGDEVIKQLGLLAEEQLNRQTQANGELVDLIMYGINAILGIAQGGFSFNVYSIIGSVFSMLGFSGLGGLISGLGGAMDNMKKVQKEDEKVAKATGKQIAAAATATQQTIQNAEGLDIKTAHVSHLSSQVYQNHSNVSTTFRSPSYTVAAGVSVETCTDKVLSSNYQRQNHTYQTIQVDQASTFKTRHSTRYHSASLIEIATQADYIASSLSTYGDFRWTQTGQTVASLPISPLETLLGELFKLPELPLTGINIDLTSYAKLTSAQFFNINYGAFYSIDGFVFINCGFGAGLASIPPRSMKTIQDLNPGQLAKRPDPGEPVSVNDKTYETLYKNNEQFQNINLGQLFTRIETVSNELLDKYSNTTERVEYFTKQGGNNN